MNLKSGKNIWEIIREDLDVRGLVVRSYDPLTFGCSLFLLWTLLLCEVSLAFSL